MSTRSIIFKLLLVFSLLLFLFCGKASSSADHNASRTTAAAPTTSCKKSSIKDPSKQVVGGILKEIQSWQTKKAIDGRPFVTLTFAQSLDGKIACKANGSKTSSNLPLSGKEARLLTHGLRSIHDAILVGGTTLSTDNPRLSNRLWGDAQPRPVVLDSSLHHVRALGSSRKARDVIICCSYEAALLYENENDYDSSLEIMPCQCDADGKLILRDVLQRLRERFGIGTIMVEGGASVLSSFLSERLVDCLCAIIAPKLLGNDRGLACFSTIKQVTTNKQQQFIDLASDSWASRFVPLGNDCIYVCQWPHDK